MANQNILFQHIQEFRRKYYLNQVMKGSIFLLLIVTSMLFVSILGEGLLGFSSGVRTGLFFTLLTVFLGVAGYLIFWPLSKLFNISKGITDFDVARMVRKHFPELVDDKLINLLELKNQNEDDNSLILAAIDKKTEELSPVPFSQAINFNLNFRYARYLGIPLLLFMLLFLISPGTLMDGSNRLINFKEDYKKPAPFEIEVTNPPKELVSGQSFRLKTKIKGAELPAELYLYLRKESETQFVNYPMDKVSPNAFDFEFSDLKEKFTYYIGNEEVSTDEFSVNVFRRPGIRKFQATVKYPGYTGLADEVLGENIGDFKVLKGSEIKWILEINGEVQQATFVGSDTAPFEMDESGTAFRHTHKVMENEDYFISLVSDKNIRNIDTVRYHVEVIADRFPSIYVNTPGSGYQADFNLEMPLDFEISDDYGFSKLTLNYRFIASADDQKVKAGYNEVVLGVKPKMLLQHKAFDVDLDNLGMVEGDEVEYFIKVWDNDYVSGPKLQMSSVFTINYLSLNEKFEEVGKNQDDMEKELGELLKEMKDVKKGYDKLEEKLLNQKKLSYDDKKELKNLLEKQSSVRQEMSELQEKFEENKEKLENNQMISEETLQKYEQLNELMKNMDNPLFEKMMENMRENMEKMDPEEMKKELEQLKFDEEDLEKSIERTMELLKQLEVQQKLEETLQKLQNLKEKQDQLNEQLEKARNEEEMKKLAEKQEALKKEMDKIKEDLKKLSEMKKDTQTPDKEEMEDLQQDAGESQENMEEAGDQMKSGEKKKGSESQKEAAKKMKEMIEKLQEMQFSSANEQDQENLEDLRTLLENLLRLSFNQEDLRDDVAQLRYGDPQLPKKGRKQKEYQDDMEMIKDSLDALARRVFEIQKFVTDESHKIVQAMESTQEFIREKRTREVVEQQHRAMTSINNLANMLSQSMEQMQQNMKSRQPGAGQCKKPGGTKPNMTGIGKQQKDLNQQMKDMMQKMLGGGKVDPASLGKMAAEQEAIRKALKEAHDQIQKDGGKSLGDLGKVMKDMEDTEEELKRKELTAETLKRQQEILNRLLDATKAVREKNEFENRRESQTGRDKDKTSPEDLSLEEYKNRIRQELLKSNQLEYSSDFIILIEKYFKLLEEQSK